MIPQRFKGPFGFGKLQDEVFEKHGGYYPEGVVDDVLVKEMVHLRPETVEFLYKRYTPTKVSYKKGSRPQLEKWLKEAVTGNENEFQKTLSICRWVKNVPNRFPTRERNTNSGFYRDLDHLLLGGTEEEVVKRGSEFCNELSRVMCIMTQMEGIPSRLVIMFHTKDVHWGHVLTECFIKNHWIMFDCTYLGIEYFKQENGNLASAYDFLTAPSIVKFPKGSESNRYIDERKHYKAAIVNYNVNDFAKYDYSWSSLKSFHKKVLERAVNKGV